MKTGAPRGSTKVPDQTATDDTVRGTRSGDVIENTGGNNVVRARGGDDHVTTGAGDDRIFGGRGDDTILSGLGDDTLFAGAGDDFVDAGDGDNLVFGGRGADTILAGSGDDTVIGGNRWWDRNGNLIDVGDGDNRVFAGFHNDTVVAGNGNDLLIGGAGNDLISAGDGDNQVYGGAGSDTIFAGAGDDTIFTGGACWWQAGDDQVDAGDGDNFIIGGAGADTISAGVGDDTIFTGWGNDVIRTGGGADLVLAGGGHDAVEFDITQPRDGGAYLSGGWGRDTLRLSMAASDLTPALQAEIDDFRQHVQDHAWHRFSFDSLNLTVRSFENIEINLLNAAPVAVDDDVSGDEDSILTGNVLTNDTDVDGDQLSVIAETVTTDNGVFEIQSDGSFTYSPDANFNGTERFAYTVRDAAGAESTATLTLTVNAVNDAPDAVDDTGAGDEDTDLTGNVLANDGDVDGDALSVVAGTVATANGLITFQENGDYSFTPNQNFNGTETVSYTVRDAAGAESTATLTLTVNAVNDAPDAADDTGAGDEDTDLTGNVLANDSDVDGDALSVVAGTVATANGLITFQENGDYSFTPNQNFNGTETVSYTVRDAAGAESTATLTLTVNAVNDAPDAVDDTGAGDEDTDLTGNVLTNDSDVEGDVLSVVAGTVVTANGLITFQENGDYSFTPNQNFNGTETVSYTVRDAAGAESTATLTLTVNAVNDAPVAVDDTGTGDEDINIFGNVLLNDAEVDGEALTAVAGTFDTPNGTFFLAENGDYTFDPDENFNGTETVSYTVRDATGTESTASLVLTINPLNDAPDAADDTGSGDEDINIFGNVLLNDVDVDGDALTAVAGTFDTPNGTFFLAENGDYTFDPDDNFNGTETVSYTVRDTSGIESTATLTLTVNAVNDAPNAVDDTGAGDEDVNIFGNVLTNDSDVEGEALSAVAGTFDTPNGTFFLAENGDYTFAPDGNFNGTETISYTVRDTSGAESTATLTLTVNAVNDAPVVVDDTGSGDEDTALTGNVLANDSDVDGDALATFAQNLDTGNGIFIIQENGDYTFTPNENFNGIETVSYTVRDADGEESTATLTLTVNPVNDAPVAVDDVGEGDEDTELSGNVLINDTDVDGDALSAVANTVETANGTFTLRQDGTYDYTPNANFNGTDTVEYTVEDTHGAQSTATLELTVNPVNDAPVSINNGQPPVLNFLGAGNGIVANDLGHHNAVTIESWVKLNGAEDDTNPIFAADRFSGREVHFNVHQNGETGRIELAIAGDPPGDRAIANVDMAKLRGWNHFAAVVDGESGITRILLNGEQIATGSTDISRALDLDGARIGDWSEDTRNLDGQMTGVRIWSEARSTDLIIKDMVEQPAAGEPGLLLDLDLENATGNIIPNRGEGPDVTLFGGAELVEGPIIATVGQRIDINGVSIADVDGEDTIQQVSIVDRNGGNLFIDDLSGATIIQGETIPHLFTIEGTVTQINGALATLNQKPNPHLRGPGEVEITVRDPETPGLSHTSIVSLEIADVLTGERGVGGRLDGVQDRTNVFHSGEEFAGIIAVDGQKDVIVVGPNSGDDRVIGFDVAQDLIDLTGISELSQFSEVIAAATNDGAHAILNLGPGVSLTLNNVSVGNLQDDNFIF